MQKAVWRPGVIIGAVLVFTSIVLVIGFVSSDVDTRQSIDLSSGRKRTLSSPPFAGFKWESDKVFVGRYWKLEGPVRQPVGGIFRPSLKAVAYVCETESNARLVELTSNPEWPFPDGVFDRILSLQVKVRGEWIQNGQQAEWLKRDSRYGELMYADGELNGLQRVWYPNGQMKVYREWKDGKMHGIIRMWREDGSMMCDVISAYNEDISGTVWYRDGEVQVFGQSEPNSPIEPTWLFPVASQSDTAD